MNDPLKSLQEIRRPRILMSAARFGLADYNRNRSLNRILRVDRTPGPSAALDALIPKEAELELERTSGESTYSFARHIELLIAMLGEARLAARAAAPN